ncbi:hypothetical protein B0I35DRAFT_516799 [Stachybotrys elegans]|uniref:Uncharacterized protein n=1 Tax=Stachybotrys elegans TaxID=80388 RepID=A0A8K0SI37_9HYPO|nr:hypothetical protein B0I35DRAFT_516799 [Stachybotrys elegans]
MTGGNTGIGYELCKILVRLDATVYMASRNKEKAEAAIASIRDQNNSNQSTGQLKFLQLDLRDLNSVKEAVLSFSSQEAKLDVLWNNAGIGANGAKVEDRTSQGFELLMGTHCIGTLLFTTLLVPKLKAVAEADANISAPSRTRVLWTISALVDSVALTNGLDFDALDVGLKDRMANYAMSKSGVWALGDEFPRRHKEDGILSLVVNPGNVKGGSYAGTPRAIMAILNATMLHKTVYGAYTQLFAGISPDLTMKDTGKCITPWSKVMEHPIHQDIVCAIKPKEEGGLEHGRKLWVWYEGKWNA